MAGEPLGLVGARNLVEAASLASDLASREGGV